MGTTETRPTGPLARALADDAGVEVFRHLLEEHRRAAVVGALPHTTRLLLAAEGAAGLEDRLGAYARAHAPCTFAAAEARGFAAFLHARRLKVPTLEEVLAFDLAVLDPTL
jgi:hypothetical protein